HIVPLPGSVTIPAGSATATIPVTMLNDQIAEPTEALTVTLSTSSTYTVGSPSQANVSLLDDEQPFVSLSATDATAREPGSDTGTFTVTRTGDLSSALAVTYSIGGSATNGTDYQTLSGTVTIAAGQLSATITVTPTDDVTAEVAETIDVALLPGSGYSINNGVTATLNLIAHGQVRGDPTVADSSRGAANAEPLALSIA